MLNPRLNHLFDSIDGDGILDLLPNKSEHRNESLFM